MMRRRTCFVAAALAFVAGLAGGWKAKVWLDVDACLDSGGAWNYQTGDCRTQ
jgi:hypothetical protein